VGAEQHAGGAGGRLGYGIGIGPYELGLGVGSSYDHHESFGTLLHPSRRDARQGEAMVEWSGPSQPWSARLAVLGARVARVTRDSLPVAWRGTSAWLALGGEGTRGPARFRATLGVGREGATRRTEFAPSLSFSFGEGPYGGRVFVERILAPVWSDLGAGQEAFLQATWLGGFDLTAGDRRGALARLGWRMGRTRDRAVVARFPLEELWLRQGFRADPDPYDFGLATAEVRWGSGGWMLGLEGYELLRDAHAIQPAVDPRRGARAWLEAGFRAFKGDLGVGLRGEAEAVGERESEVAPALSIPGYASYGAAAVLALADATVALRFRNLENRRRPETWPDPATREPAIGPGMEFRLVFGWRLYN
jgi:hypothetical protein